MDGKTIGWIAGLVAAGVAVGGLGVWRLYSEADEEAEPVARPKSTGRLIAEARRDKAGAGRTTPMNSTEGRLRGTGRGPRLTGPVDGGRWPLPSGEAVPATRWEAFQRQNANRVYSEGTEQLLDCIFNTRLGDMPMPIPYLDEEDRRRLAGVLVAKCVIGEKDSETTAERKEVVNLAKAELMKYIKSGGDPDAFLQYYNNELKRAYALRSEAADQVEAAWAEDAALGREFLEAVNERLAADGIRPLEAEQFED